MHILIFNHFTGTIFALAILSHKFRMDDALIGTIASICDLLAAIAFLLVSQSWQLYLGKIIYYFIENSH